VNRENLLNAIKVLKEHCDQETCVTCNIRKECIGMVASLPEDWEVGKCMESQQSYLSDY